MTMFSTQPRFATFNVDSFGLVKSFIQSDGKVLLVGGSRSVGIIVARFDTNGQLDTGFGVDGNGVVKLANSDTYIYPNSIAITNSGSITASTGNSYLELSADGKAIKTLLPHEVASGDGIPFPYSYYFQQADGKFIGSGTTPSSLMRYNPDGSIDRSFGKGTSVVVPGTVTAIAQQPDGKLVVNLQNTSGLQIGEGLKLARYTVDGELDKTFFGGIVEADPTLGKDYLYSVAIQGDGKILVAGSSSSNLLVLRYLSNGRLDTAFGDNGIVTGSFGQSAGGFQIGSRATSVSVQADGKIIIVGTVGEFGPKPMVLRLNPDGSADPSYGQPFYNMVGDSGDDTFELFAGSKTYINGLGGNDTLLLRTQTKDWSIVQRADDWLLVRNANPDNTVVLKNVEQVNFMFGTGGKPEIVTLQKGPTVPNIGVTNQISVAPDETYINGTTGIDVAVYSGNLSGFTIQNKSGTITLSSLTTGSDTLRNVERLKFNDKVLAFDDDGNAGKAYRLYQAAFDRKPDPEGLGFWINALDTGNSMQSVSSGFVGSTEFKNLYGANPSNFDFLTRLYQNVLHRAPDQDGFNWWLGHLNSGAASKVQTLIDFSESSENQVNVIGSIKNGIEYTFFS